MAGLELADIQGNVLVGYDFPRAEHLFCRVPDAARGRRFLHLLLADGIQSAIPWSCKPPTATNVALTCAGLEALGVADAMLAALPEAFRQPMRDRAQELLGDTGANRPEDWDLDTSDAHLLVLVAGSGGRARKLLRRRVAQIERHAAACDIAVTARQSARSLSNAREHFGFADGFGQPAVEGAPTPRGAAASKRPGQGVPLPDGVRWRDVKAGEFILGYADEDGQFLCGPAAALLRNGSYLVYRKLKQDVAAFEALLRDEGRRYADVVGLDGGDAHVRETLAAKLVGRWRDGVALSVAPRRPLAEVAHLRSRRVDDPDNDFRYARDDAQGGVCPRGAHIRRTNPRDALAGGASMSRRHRIIRRGMAYGEPLFSSDDDGRERGLIFMCFNADIERQFESVQARWCNDGNAFWLGEDRDVFSGVDGASDTFTIQGEAPYLLRRRQVVYTRGSAYLLMPGLTALRDIADENPVITYGV